MKQIAEALIKVQSELPAMAKDTQGHGFEYLSLDKILATARPILAKHGITAVQLPAAPSFPGNIAVRTILLHTSGESIDQVGEIPAPAENGRMNAAQAAGAAITYLRRYSLAAALGIVSDMDMDAVAKPDILDYPELSLEEINMVEESPAAEFLTLLTDIMPEHLGHENHAKNAMMKHLGLNAIPGSVNGRLDALANLKRHYQMNGVTR